MYHRNSLLLIFIAAALLLAAGCTQSVAENRSAGKLDGFDLFVTQKINEYRVPGAVVGIVENDSVVFLKGFGVREIGKPEKVDPDTRFQIASVTKYITAQAIGTLVDEGRLGWDTPVITYIPDFALNDSYVTEHVTLRDLLAHRTGLKEYDGDILGREGYSAREMIKRLRYLDLPHGFREKYAYSNAGYFIAGEVAAAVDNRSWEDLTDARVIRPLNMTRSGAHPESLYLDENYALAHGDTNENITLIPSEEAAFPAGGQIISTGRDMTQVLRMMLNDGSVDGRCILSNKTVGDIHEASMVAGRSGPLGDPNGAVCLGCDTYNFLGQRVIEKNGALEGVRSIVILIPEKKAGLVVIANKQLTVFPEAVRDEFLERYIGRSNIDLQAREQTNQKGWYSLIKNMEAPVNVRPATIPASAIEGTYTSDLYGTMILHEGPDATYMTVALGPSQYPGTLVHQAGNTWYLSWPNPDDMVGYLTFIVNSQGKVTGFTSGDYGSFVRA